MLHFILQAHARRFHFCFGFVQCFFKYFYSRLHSSLFIVLLILYLSINYNSRGCIQTHHLCNICIQRQFMRLRSDDSIQSHSRHRVTESRVSGRRFEPRATARVIRTLDQRGRPPSSNKPNQHSIFQHESNTLTIKPISIKDAESLEHHFYENTNKPTLNGNEHEAFNAIFARFSFSFRTKRMKIRAPVLHVWIIEGITRT